MTGPVSRAAAAEATPDSPVPPDPSADPVWDEHTDGWITRLTDRFVVSWAPMLFNDRLFVTRRSDYPRTWVTAWCFDKGPAAALAAAVFDPEVDMEPPGFKKLAFDGRTEADLPSGASSDC